MNIFMCILCLIDLNQLLVEDSAFASRNQSIVLVAGENKAQESWGWSLIDDYKIEQLVNLPMFFTTVRISCFGCQYSGIETSSIFPSSRMQTVPFCPDAASITMFLPHCSALEIKRFIIPAHGFWLSNDNSRLMWIVRHRFHDFLLRSREYFIQYYRTIHHRCHSAAWAHCDELNAVFCKITIVLQIKNKKNADNSLVEFQKMKIRSTYGQSSCESNHTVFRCIVEWWQCNGN